MPSRPRLPDDDAAAHAAACHRRRIVVAEINRRRVNEAVERGTDPTTPTMFLCECGQLGCTAKVRLRTDEYEAVREHFEQFVVAPGHPVPGIDHVLADRGTHVLVAKAGHAADVARRSDPRADDDR